MGVIASCRENPLTISHQWEMGPLQNFLGNALARPTIFCHVLRGKLGI